jgi:dihydrofolate reductase
MRRLFWQMMMSLDGYMAGPGGEMDWFVTDDEFGQYVLEMGKTIDTIVFGRRTYEMMASYWPTSTDPEAPMMNELPKVVFSRTPSKLSKLDWNNSRVARGSVAEEIAKLKAAPGRDIAMFGSADLASTFNKLGLIDEYRIFVNPVVVGRGLPLFKDAERMPL